MNMVITGLIALTFMSFRDCIMIYIANISVFSGVIMGLVGVLSLLEKKLIGGGDCKVLN